MEKKYQAANLFITKSYHLFWVLIAKRNKKRNSYWTVDTIDGSSGLLNLTEAIAELRERNQLIDFDDPNDFFVIPTFEANFLEKFLWRQKREIKRETFLDFYFDDIVWFRGFKISVDLAPLGTNRFIEAIKTDPSMVVFTFSNDTELEFLLGDFQDEDADFVFFVNRFSILFKFIKLGKENL